MSVTLEMDQPHHWHEIPYMQAGGGGIEPAVAGNHAPGERV